MDEQTLARAIRDHYQEHPDARAADVAAAVDVSEEQVAEVLDSYRVKDTGGVEKVGRGQGGGWLPTDEAAG